MLGLNSRNVFISRLYIHTYIPGLYIPLTYRLLVYNL